MNDEPIKPDPEKKPKRPADGNQRAKLIVDLATGQVDDQSTEEDKARVGSAGGKARAKALTPEQRSEIAKRAASKRWGD